MRALVFLACVAAAACAGVDQCSWGPSYWCSDVRIAKQCGAVKHCTDTVWKTKRLDSVESSETCVICQMVVSKLREELKTLPKEEIVSMMNKMCAVLPEAEEKTCKDLVNNYSYEIFELLASKLDPKEICGALTLCSGFQDPVHHAAKAAARVFVPRLHGELECSLCKQAISELRTLAQDKDMQNELENFLEERVCPILGAENATCIEYVKMYAPVVFQIAANELDPNVVCTALRLCTQAKATLAHLVRVPLKKAPMHVVSFKPAAKPATTNVKNSPQCTLCEFVMKEVDSLLMQNRSEQAIVGALDKVCSLLPSTISAECLSFVNQYAPAIIDLLVQEVDPQMVCTSLGLCTGTSLKVKAATPVKVRGSVQCTLCQELVNYINEFLNENSTVAEIEELLNKVCNLLPSTYKSQCSDFVEKYGPTLAQYLKELDDPLKVCQALNECPATKSSLLGGKECTWGPSYWCANQENAARCGAVEHCRKHVWN